MIDELSRMREVLAYPSLNRCYVPVATSSNEVQFRCGPWSGPVFTVTDSDGDEKLASFVERLDGTRHVDTLLAEFDPGETKSVLALLAELYNAGVVYDSNGDDHPVREYSVVTPSLSATDLDRLRASSVLVVATGLLGRFVVEDLHWMDVERVAVASSPDTEGPASFDAAPRAGDVQFDDSSVEHLDVDPVAAVAEFDVVVHAADRPQPTLLERLDAAAIEASVPWTSAQLLGFDGIVGPTVVPGESACYRCFERRTATTIPDADAYEAYEEAGEPARGATLPPFARVVAGTLTADLVHLLATGFGFTVGNVVHHDFLEHTVESNRVLKLPRCPRCGRSTDAPATNQLVTMERLAELWGDGD